MKQSHTIFETSPKNGSYQMRKMKWIPINLLTSGLQAKKEKKNHIQWKMYDIFFYEFLQVKKVEWFINIYIRNALQWFDICLMKLTSINL